MADAAQAREDEGEEAAGLGCQPCEDDAPTGAQMRISDGLMASFGAHVDKLSQARLARKEQLRPKSIVETLVQEQEIANSGLQAAATGGSIVPIITQDGNLDPGSVWKRLDSDQFEGDAVIRCLYSLLDLIDDRGYQRSPHQIRFHDSFIRATSRVMYKSEWGSDKPAIMRSKNWDKCPSEILISTPRRFGKTFS